MKPLEFAADRPVATAQAVLDAKDQSSIAITLWTWACVPYLLATGLVSYWTFKSFTDWRELSSALPATAIFMGTLFVVAWYCNRSQTLELIRKQYLPLKAYQMDRATDLVYQSPAAAAYCIRVESVRKLVVGDMAVLQECARLDTLDTVSQQKMGRWPGFMLRPEATKY